LGGSLQAEVPGQDALADMPVREVTVFKDGHAFVLHEGSVATDAGGDVLLDYLPTAVIGTFWAYADDGQATLSAVSAGRKVVSVSRTALTVPEMIEANIGARVRIQETRDVPPYEATILGVPARSSEELQRTSPPGAPPQLPVKAGVVLLKVDGGTKALAMDQIRDVTFLDSFKPNASAEEFRNVMTLKLNWEDNRPGESANVGMVYVQRGLRWIPNYRVDIDGEGKATFKLQATLVNELADLEGVTAHLVIGVPTFAFQDMVDPISMQETAAQVTQHMRRDSRTAYSFSNAIMSQAVATRARHSVAPAPTPTVDLGPEVADAGKHEDLYVFTVENITLDKGQRMTVFIDEFELNYEDVFLLDVPFGPPPEARANLNTEQQAIMARLLHAPKVKHAIRMTNTSEAPLTTAPALIFRQGRVIAQGMMTYTAIGGSTDLELTTAVDVTVKTEDSETKRTPNAQTWHGHSYDRVDLAGSIDLTNHREDAVTVEVRRWVLGHLDEASHDAKVDQVGRQEGESFTTGGRFPWWQWYNWPHWWRHVNTIGRASWTVKLESGQHVALTYAWHYFWR